MRFLYSFGIHLFHFFIQISSLFNSKAKAWVLGRKNLFQKLKADIPLPIDIWMHCASLGEFEQGRPLLETLRKQYPNKQILLTFFSPSGYEIRKNYKQVDFVYYLPIDTSYRARYFLDIVQPQMAIFVKYEFWQNYLFELQKRNISTLLISAIFHSKQPFFQWYAPLFRPALDCFTQIFVQNKSSAKLLDEIGVQHYQIAGDTRVDRVLEIAKSAKAFPIIEQFKANQKTLIAGSTWPPDEAILAAYINENTDDNWKYIFAPHDISESHILELSKRFDIAILRYTEVDEHTDLASLKILIVDTIGMLSQIYQYGEVAYIGGGFGAGIHNTLEPIAFDLPVIFGPKYQKFEEAIRLVELGGGFVAESKADFETIFEILKDAESHLKTSQAVSSYIQANQGATDKILDYIQS